MQALFNLLCGAAITAQARGALCRVSASFHTALLCEVLQAAAPPSEALLQAAIPHLLPGLTASAHPHLRAASLAAAACMCACATLSADLAAALVTDACSHVSPASARETLLCFAHVLATQRALHRPPLRAVAALLCMPGLPQEVSAARADGLRVDGAAAELVCNAPLLLEPPSDPGEAPAVPAAAVPTVHETTVQLVRGLDLRGGPVGAAELCKQAALALRHASGADAVALASAIVQELKAMPRGAGEIEEAVRQAADGASEAAKQRLHAALAGVGEASVPGMLVGAELTAALQADASSEAFTGVVASLRRLKAAGELDGRMHARVAEAALGALRAADAKVVADAVKSPLLELLPVEEVVPELLRCLRRVSRRLAKPLGAAAVEEGAGLVGVGGGGMLWQMDHAVLVAMGCLEALCEAAGGKREWERAIVAMVLPWFLVADAWPSAGLAHVAGMLAKLEAWRAVFGDGAAAALRAAAAARERGAGRAGDAAGAAHAQSAEGVAAAATGKKRGSKGKGEAGRGETGEGGAVPDEAGVTSGTRARSSDVWVRQRWAAAGIGESEVDVTTVDALRALQGSFVAAAAATKDTAQAWQALADAAAADGLASRHVAGVVAMAAACAGDVEGSAVAGACANWLVMQLCDEATIAAVVSVSVETRKRVAVADKGGGLLVRPLVFPQHVTFVHMQLSLHIIAPPKQRACPAVCAAYMESGGACNHDECMRVCRRSTGRR